MKDNYRNRYYNEHAVSSVDNALPAYEEKTASKTRKGVIHTAKLINVRKEADASMPVVTVLREGDSVEIVGEKNNYYKIHFGREQGYVLKKYCKEV